MAVSLRPAINPARGAVKNSLVARQAPKGLIKGGVEYAAAWGICFYLTMPLTVVLIFVLEWGGYWEQQAIKQNGPAGPTGRGKAPIPAAPKPEPALGFISTRFHPPAPLQAPEPAAPTIVAVAENQARVPTMDEEWEFLYDQNPQKNQGPGPGETVH